MWQVGIAVGIRLSEAIRRGTRLGPFGSALLVAFLCLLGLPAPAHAQSAISGVVRDVSSAVLPGVTIEASSPVLI